MQYRELSFFDNTDEDIIQRKETKMPEINSNNILKVSKNADLDSLFVNRSTSKEIQNNYSDVDFGFRVQERPLELLDIPKNKIKQLHNSSIYNINELLKYYPSKYIDFSNDKTVNNVIDKETCSMIGRITSINGSDKFVSAICEDKNGQKFMAIWFHQPYIRQTLEKNYQYIFCGKINITDNNFVQIVPTAYSRNIEELKRIVPEYKKIRGMSDDYLNKCIDTALNYVARIDYLRRDIVEKFNLIPQNILYEQIHRPDSFDQIKKARERIVFDKLFAFNLNLRAMTKDSDTKNHFQVNNFAIWKEIYEKLPYKFTQDQELTVKHMASIVHSSNRLSCLIQGDVGSGKTIVAFFMLALSKANGFQGALIAPTEVLAKQHYLDFKELFDDLGITSCLLTGKLKAKDKKDLYKKIKNNEVNVIIGTHALIQDSVEYENLGLVVIDEQHRFGVDQRNKLLNTDKKPHIIIMSATPIPRTLSLALYGDYVKVFNIKTKPAGRKDIITKKVKNPKDGYDFIHEEIKKGKQAYIVCPLIENSTSEKMGDVKSVAETEKEIKEYFGKYPEIKIASINGKMKNTEIEEEIDEFVKKETDILISTTIVEVGVNVPNASVIMIKNSERFGLAQLHQLRGRVGRSSYQSYCLLSPKGEDVKSDILCSSTDGFEISKQDLALRGSGDLIGVKQSGDNEDVMLMLEFPELYEQINECNAEYIKDPSFIEDYKYIVEVDKDEQ